MFYWKNRQSQSIIDISSIRSEKNRNQNRMEKICCESSSDEFVRQTKTNISEIFHQTHFHELIEEIQHGLTPIVEQLRQQLEQKDFLTRKQRWNCMKSCAKFLCENFTKEKFDLTENDVEFECLKKLLDRKISPKQIHVGVQTIDDLEKYFHRMSIETDETKAKKIPSNNGPIDDEIRQKISHRSASRAFRKLTSDLHRLTDEIPFQSHLKRYHQHRH